MTLKNILREEIGLISLSDLEVSNLSKVAKELIKSLRAKGLKAYVGGSLAKGTLIRKEGGRSAHPKLRSVGAQDVDIFVVFDSSADIPKLGKVLGKIDLPGKLKKVHGSRDYFQIICDGVILEVIPVLKNVDPELVENVTDFSLSHVKYVKSEVKKNPKIADEIKLAKAFCRANRCYGAEGYVRGFSGYSLEILIIYFGGFVKFLKSFEKLERKKKKIVLDPLKYFRNEREVLMDLNGSKLNGPVVLVDPTYKFRNVSAGLGFETFDRFVDVARKFLKKPGLDFFEKRDIDVEKIRNFADKNGCQFLELKLSTTRQAGDIAGTKMKKLFDFFVRELTRKEQRVLRKEFDYSGSGNASGYLVVREKSEVERRGPSVDMKDAVLAFKKSKGKNVFEKKGFLWCREKVSVEEILKFVRKSEKEMGAKINLF